MKKLLVLTIAAVFAALPLKAQVDTTCSAPADTSVTELFTNANMPDGAGTLDVHQSGAVRDAFFAKYRRPAGNITAKGFRVVVYKSNTQRARSTAQSIVSTIQNNYGYPAYIKYNNPDFFVMVGDCRTRSEAEGILSALKRNYSTAYVTEDKINISIVTAEE